MKTSLLLSDGKTVQVVLPYRECRYVVAPGWCEHCSSKRVIIAHDIRETVIFNRRPETFALAVSHLLERGCSPEALGPSGCLWVESRLLPSRLLTKDGGPLVQELAEDPPDQWRVMGIDSRIGEYQATATAVCFRCRSKVGELRTEFDTLFGRREDELVLSGRYGIVIGAGS